MNQQVDASRLAADEYSLLINGRNRYDTIDPITQPADVTPAGVVKVQGCYAAGALLVMFADGKAYYRNEALPNQTFTQIAGFQLSADVDTLFAVLVPASTVNGVRSLTDDANTSAGVLLSGTSASSPQAMLVQDGVNQPMLIFPDGTVRVTQNYNQWLPDQREYVPLGKQMLFNSGILYIVSPDGLQLYRSVTGRPLDFMVIVDTAANKLPSELEGGAAQISHKVDYAPITAIAALSSPDGSFYVSTARTSYAVRPDFTVLPYGEPTFVNTFLFTTGAVNHFCVCDILGDNAVVDYSGIRSFNSVGQYRIEGKNSPFSSKISRLLTGIRQVTPAAVTFDNYGLFSVQTVFGGGILVFDTLTQQWSSLDLMPSLTAQVIQMFAEVKTAVNRKLFCSTTTKVFELYPETGLTEVPSYYSPEFNSGDPTISQKATQVRLTFLDVLTPGTVWVTPVEDGKVGTMRSARLQNVLPEVQSAIPPVLQRGTDKVRVATVSVVDIAKSCWKAGLYIQWNFSGKLAAVKLIANAQSSNVSFEEQVALSEPTTLFITTIARGELVAGATVHIFGGGLASASTLALNGIDVEFVIVSDGWLTVVLPDGWTYGLPPLSADVVDTNGSRFVWAAGLASADDNIIGRDNVNGGQLVSVGAIDLTQPPAVVVAAVIKAATPVPVVTVPVVVVTNPGPAAPTLIPTSVTPSVVPNGCNTQAVVASVPVPPGCDTIYTLPEDGAQVFAGFPAIHFVDVTASTQGFAALAGLLFTQNSDGTYTFFSSYMEANQGPSPAGIPNLQLARTGFRVLQPNTVNQFQIHGFPITFCVYFGKRIVHPPCAEIPTHGVLTVTGESEVSFYDGYWSVGLENIHITGAGVYTTAERYTSIQFGLGTLWCDILLNSGAPGSFSGSLPEDSFPDWTLKFFNTGVGVLT
tara:strand:- start:1362 stop:4118 length:2757 start_codon:yes stop_codon:yes gene_type:complete